jgi:Flp pilus assembly protein TadG
MRVLKRSMPRGDRLRRGAAAAEMALILPFLALILVGTIDFCRLFFAYTTITNVARNGALWASDPLAPTQSPYTTVQQAALGAPGLLADANQLNPALTASNVTQTSGTDGQGNATAIVTVKYKFNMISSYLGFGSVNITRQVAMRVEPLVPN